MFTSFSTALSALSAQATAVDVVGNNLANLNTPGFRAEMSAFRAVPVIGDGAPTRAFVLDSTIGSDFRPGVIQNTGRDLDVAVQGRGWIAVQASDGSEAYTRSGSFQIGANGILQTLTGQPVLGDGGPISIPPDTTVTIASDGTVSTIPTNAPPTSVAIAGRIKLVNPPEAQLKRGADGLFRLPGGNTAQADAAVKLAPEALESSNVNAAEAMVAMIASARAFDMQMKLLQNAQDNSRAAAQLLSASK